MLLSLTITPRSAPSVTDLNTNIEVRWHSREHSTGTPAIPQPTVPCCALHVSSALKFLLRKMDCNHITMFPRGGLAGSLRITITCTNSLMGWLFLLLLRKEGGETPPQRSVLHPVPPAEAKPEASSPRAHSLIVQHLFTCPFCLSASSSWGPKLHHWGSKIQFCLQCQETLNHLHLERLHCTFLQRDQRKPVIRHAFSLLPKMKK